MEKNKNTSNNLKTQDLVDLVYDTATGCYGVVGICQKGAKNLSPLNKEEAKKGIIIRKINLTNFSVEVNLILSHDVKISEAIRETQKSLLYVLNKKSGNCCKGVDVFALAVK